LTGFKTCFPAEVTTCLKRMSKAINDESFGHGKSSSKQFVSAGQAKSFSRRWESYATMQMRQTWNMMNLLSPFPTRLTLALRKVVNAREIVV